MERFGLTMLDSYLRSIDLMRDMDNEGAYYRVEYPSQYREDYDSDEEYNDAQSVLFYLHIDAFMDVRDDTIRTIEIPIDRNKNIEIDPMAGWMELTDLRGELYRFAPYISHRFTYHMIVQGV
jgi:hypothetical protein